MQENETVCTSRLEMKHLFESSATSTHSFMHEVDDLFVCFVLTFGAITVGAAYKLLLQFQAFLVRNKSASLSGASVVSVLALMSQHFFIRPLEKKSHKKRSAIAWMGHWMWMKRHSSYWRRQRSRATTTVLRMTSRGVFCGVVLLKRT